MTAPAHVRSHPSALPTVVMITATALLSGLALALLGWRAERAGVARFTFLEWNLFLAWIPVPLAVLVSGLERLRTPTVILALATLPWLAFLPNAPYLVTDFIHLAPRDGVPLWADAGLIGSFALAGLAAGLVSLHMVHGVVDRRLGGGWGWTMVAGVVVLSAAGVYLGRVLRFNSWDLLHRSDELASLVLMRAHDPLGNPTLTALMGVISLIMGASYLLVRAVSRGLRPWSIR